VAGIAAAVLLALAGALDYYQSLSATSASGDRFQIAVQAERFRGVAAALPSNAVAGYISDVPLSDAAGQVLFGAARYALAPVLLTVSGSKVRPEWVVPGRCRAWAPRRYGLRKRRGAVPEGCRTMIGLVVFLMPLAAGWCFADAMLSRLAIRPPWAAATLKAAVGAGLGIAVSSILFFLVSLLEVASALSVTALNVALVAVGVAALWRARRQPAGELPSPAAPPAFRWNWVLALALALGFALVLSGLFSVAGASSLGDWDAWSIWNLRAKFLAGPGDAWKRALSPLLERSHPEYPLLTSGFIAMVWKASGNAAPWVPQATGFVFLGLIAALLAGVLGALRGLTTALLAGFVLLASSSFLFLATMQYADLPLSFYYLASVALLVLGLAGEGHSSACLVLAGACASCAAWTKNEGAPFAVLVVLGVATMKWRAALRLALGAAPVLALVVCFKLFRAPAADPLLHQSVSQVIHKLADPARYAQIGAALVAEAYHFGQPWSHPLLLLAILAAALRFRPDRMRAHVLRAAWVILGLVFLTYCGVYLITPNDLGWQLQTSLPRLYGQLWPSALLLVFLMLGAPAAVEPAQPARKARRVSARRS
jgi:hypothetical protein